MRVYLYIYVTLIFSEVCYFTKISDSYQNACTINTHIYTHTDFTEVYICYFLDG